MSLPRLLPPAASIAALALLVTGTALGQPTVSWNRKLVDVTWTPSPGGPAGLWDIHATWLFELDGDGTVADLGTEANVSWGPPTLGAFPEDCLIWDIKDGCTADCAAGSTGPCGDADVDGVPVTLTCDPGVDLCRSPVLSGVVPSAALVAGDEIVVILRPSPGAVPDTDTSDDSLTIPFGSTGTEGEQKPSSWGGVKALYR